MPDLLFVDVDGTLLGPNGVPESAWRAVERAHAAGLKMAICTGRPGRGFALDFARRLAPDGPHIFDAGASIIHPEGQVFHAAQLPHSLIGQVAKLAERDGHAVEIYTADGRFLTPTWTDGIAQHGELLGFTPEVIDLARLPPDLMVVRVQFLVKNLAAWTQTRSTVAAWPQTELHEATSPGMPEFQFCGLTRSGVDKGQAAQWVATHYGLTLIQCAAVGDGDNDLPLLKAVDLGIAMGNASPRLKSLAAYTVSRVDEDGFAEAISRLI